MTQTEYDQKKRECWGEYVNMLNRQYATKYVFDKIFDCAYALGKQDKDEEGEEMLSIERILIQSYYNAHKNSRDILYDLFGSKCLRDEPASEVASEPKSETDKCFDNILKDSFRNERRLNIAAIAMQGILSNPQLLKIAIETYQEEIGSPDIYVAVAKTAKEQADALIAECEEGGKS